MGFWDRVLREKKSKSSKRDAKDREALKEVLEEQKNQEEAEAKKTAAEEAKKIAAEEAKKQAELKARQEAAQREQERLTAANRAATQERNVINPDMPIQERQQVQTRMAQPVRQSIGVAPEKVISNTLNNNLLEKEEEKNKNENFVEYVDPITNKVYLVKPGEKPPKGTVLKKTYTKKAYNTASTAIQKARENKEALTKGKRALAPSTNKTSWKNSAGTGQLAMSAAKVGLSNVVNVDPNNLTKEQKEEFAKEQAWKNMSYAEKQKARNTLPDKDGDLVPDMYDCVPDDYAKQGYADVYLGGKYALGPSRKGQNWRTAANSGQLAKSAAKVELSSVINVDPKTMTEAQKETYAKEQTWKNMSETEKILARQTLPDKDGDLVPDMYDCVPDDYTKQGYADVYLGGKYALGPSKKMQRNIVTGKGRLQMATSMKGPKDVVGAVVNEAGVGNILDFVSGGSTAGKNPSMSGKTNGKASTEKVMNKIMGPSNGNKSTIVKSKSNKNFQVNMSKNFKQKFDVNVINKKKFGTKAASKKGMEKPVADKVFKKMSKKYGF